MPTEVFEHIKKVLSLLSQKEVKTPLSFFFRTIFYISMVVAITIIWGKPELQQMVFLIFISLLLLVTILVAIFAWFRPKNLVYGETGHRAEMKLAFGTEKAQLTAAEISYLSGTEKPALLPTGGATP
jgi:high-affinity K+ transport system ATPase subunit B